MKSRIFSGSWVTFASMALFAVSVTNVPAQDSAATTPATTPTVSANPAAPVELSYTAAEVLKLARAEVSDDTIIAFIENSRSGYGLNAAAIVYLKNEGVADRVITTMLSQDQKVMTDATRAAPQPATADFSAINPVVPAPASTFYTIPFYSAAYSYYSPFYSYYPYSAYAPWYYWYSYYPALSYSYVIGNSWNWGNRYHGGYHGNSYRSGGYRGGLPGNRPPPNPPSAGYRGRSGGPPGGGGIRIGGRSGGSPPSLGYRGRSGGSPGGGFRGGAAPSVRPSSGGFRGSAAPSMRPSGGGFRGGGSPGAGFSGGGRGGSSGGSRR